jgi:hypothetical protein
VKKAYSPKYSTFNQEFGYFIGWMYAAMFLTLMVIFMGTVTFLPHNAAVSIQKENSASTVVFDQPMIILYNSFDLVQIEIDIRNFLQQNNLSQMTQVISAEFIGGYDAQSESNAVAIARARVFQDQLIATKLERLNNVVTSLSASSTIATNQVVLRLFFSP